MLVMTYLKEMKINSIIEWNREEKEVKVIILIIKFKELGNIPILIVKDNLIIFLQRLQR